MMKIFKVLFLALLGFSFVGCASAQTNKRKPMKKTEPKITEKMNENSIGSELKILAEGLYGSLETPFLFVARSAETYVHLQKFVENLPPESEIDFTRTAVVAAFAGTKNTGGYSVTVKKVTDKIRIDVIEPPKDAMTTDALTTPFTISLVPIEEGNSLPLEVSANWKNAMQTYTITSGEFNTSSESASRLKKFNAEGTIGVLIFGDYVTLIFNLSGKGTNKNRRLAETASGIVKANRIDLSRLGTGSFADNPQSRFNVSGTLGDNKLSLFFEPLRSNADGKSQTNGKIEAVKTR
jgi:hypothetical protein